MDQSSSVTSIMVGEGRRLLATKEYVGLQYQAEGPGEACKLPEIIC